MYESDGVARNWIDGGVTVRARDIGTAVVIQDLPCFAEKIEAVPASFATWPKGATSSSFAAGTASAINCTVVVYGAGVEYTIATRAPTAARAADGASSAAGTSTSAVAVDRPLIIYGAGVVEAVATRTAGTAGVATNEVKLAVVSVATRTTVSSGTDECPQVNYCAGVVDASSSVTTVGTVAGRVIAGGASTIGPTIDRPIVIDGSIVGYAAATRSAVEGDDETGTSSRSLQSTFGNSTKV